MATWSFETTASVARRATRPSTSASLIARRGTKTQRARRDDLPYGVIVRERTVTVSNAFEPDMESATGEWVYSPVYADDGLPAGDSNEYEEYTSLAAAQARCIALAKKNV